MIDELLCIEAYGSCCKKAGLLNMLELFRMACNNNFISFGLAKINVLSDFCSKFSSFFKYKNSRHIIWYQHEFVSVVTTWVILQIVPNKLSAFVSLICVSIS